MPDLTPIALLVIVATTMGVGMGGVWRCLRSVPVAVGLALFCAQAAAALTISPLPRSDYTVRAVCRAPTSRHAGCLALQLVAQTAQARAHTHPIGITRAARAIPSAPLSPAQGAFGLRPQDLHTAYQLPSSASGTQTIALVDSYNDLTAGEDLAAYAKEFGLPECTASDGCFRKVNQSGETGNLPFPQSAKELETARKGSSAARKEAEEATGWGLEISLDIEMAHAICQTCDILLVESNTPSYEDLEKAERTAALLGAGEISNSWGGSEAGETPELESSSPFEHPGIAITAAAGDNGYLGWDAESKSERGYVDFPASSPHVVAVGGTRLTLGSGSAWSGESVWNGDGAGGGGCSTVFTAQPWQQNVSDWSAVGCATKRAVADVAADADPYTGVAVHYTSPDCEYQYEEAKVKHVVYWCAIGGTSVASPLIASVFALAGGAGGVAYPAQTLYESELKSPASLHDVTVGSNGECSKPFTETGLSGCTPAEEAEKSCASKAICLAGSGYDGPTGVGTPDVIAAFTAPSAPTIVAPSAPTGVTAAGATGQALVSWSVPSSDGGSAITSYTVTPYVGGSALAPVEVGVGATSAIVKGLANGTGYTFTVTAANAVGSGLPSGASSVVVPRDTIFDFATPATVDSGDARSVELGVKFASEVAGEVTGIRFYKGATNTGTHIGSLWSASGALLAEATFTSETASGWQQVNFSTPVAIAANTTYVAAYFAPKGDYSDTSSAFVSAGFANPPLSALANSLAANGVYAYSATPKFPASTYKATNYWVDLDFEPTAVPGQVTNVSATAGNGSASLTWSAPSGGAPATSYTITPYIGSIAQSTTTVSGSPPATGATVGGLTNGTSYTFTVTAANAAGPGPASEHSNAVTPTASTIMAPSAPTGVTAAGATGQALVSWSVPSSDGGSAITSYTVTPYVGGSALAPVEVGVGATSAIVKGLANGTGYTFTVTAANAVGSGLPSGASSVVVPRDTIFDFATPATVDSGDARSVELGVKFASEVAGEVTGIRFYKGATNTGTHIGSLWSASGALLAEATFTSETASGWQQVNFSTPVAIAANTTYVAAYFAPKGDYSDTSSAFVSAGFANPPLSALANSLAANGVYAYSATPKFPASTYKATNYWVDLDFEP